MGHFGRKSCLKSPESIIPLFALSKMLSTATSGAALKTVLSVGRIAFNRNLATSTVALQKAQDPIQAMFAEKVKEYAAKKAKAGGKLVDSTPAIEANLQMELDKVAKAYGGGAGVDMAKFPELKFVDPQIEDVSLKQ